MSLSVTKYPSIITPAKNPVVFELTGELYVPGVKALLQLEYSVDESVGAIYTLEYGETQAILTCMLNPLEDGTEFPARQGEPWDEWLDMLIYYFGLNERLDSFDITADAQSKLLIFTAKEVGDQFTIDFEVANGTVTEYKNKPGEDAVLKEYHRIGLQVWRYLFDGPEIMIAEDLVSPVYDGNVATAVFDVSELLQPYLGGDFTADNGAAPALVNRDEVNPPYLIKYWEQWGIDSEVDRVYTSAWMFSLNGFIPSFKQADFYGLYDNFLDYLVTTKKMFLTWHWHEKITDFYAPERLYLILPSDPGTTSFKVRVTVHYIDDGDTVIDHAITKTVYPYEVFEIDASYESLVGSIDTTVIGYDVKFMSASGTFYSETFKFLIDQQASLNTRYFVFRNSLGGFECARFLGEETNEFSMQRSFYDQSALVPIDDFLAQKKQLIPETTRTFKINTGWIGSAEVEWLRDFLVSTEIFEVVDAVKRPVLITQDKLELNKDNIFLYSLTLTMEYMDMDSVYQKEETASWETVAEIIDPYS